jgi:positive regulator of sigma E activity
LKCTFIVYIIPVLGLLIGALAADTLADLTGIKPGAAILLFTLIGFCMGVWFSRIMLRRKGAAMGLIPCIKRIY